MAKLKPDVIEWILKLNSTQAQEEYHKLEKESKSLKASISATCKEKVELERYKKEVETSQYLGAEERKERLEELKETIRSTERQLLTDTGKFSAELREMMNNPLGVEVFYCVWKWPKRHTIGHSWVIYLANFRT